jgi:hypothetical protein
LRISDFGPGEIDAKIISRGKIAEFGRLRGEKYVAALPRLFFSARFSKRSMSAFHECLQIFTSAVISQFL